MASIFKRRKGKHEPYTIQYSDHLGKRRTKLGFTDKGLTEQLAAKLETEARLRRTGMVDPELERLAKTRLTPLGELLDLFEQSLSDNSPKYVKLTMSQVRRVIDGIGFKSLADLDAEAVQTYLRSLRTPDGIGHRTYNQYLQALGAFCNWCVTTKRLPSNPLVGIERLNTAVDVRHARRALTAEEAAQLIESARSSGVRIQGYTGEQRARIYLTSYLTGLRRNELASLTRRSFDLESATPTITVEAVSSKHRQKDVLPLHPELVGMLREWLHGMQPGEKLFPKLASRKTWRMVKKDLERVGIPYETEAGIADFHAAGRHTHITELLRNGASLPEAKELARHSDIKTTMRYTHIGLKDQARAVAGLKMPVRPTKNSHREPAALHGRCVSSGAESPKASSPVIEDDPKKRQSPRKNEGRVIVCHRETLGVLVGATGHQLNFSWKDWQSGTSRCLEFKGIAKLSVQYNGLFTDGFCLRGIFTVFEFIPTNRCIAARSATRAYSASWPPFLQSGQHHNSTTKTVSTITFELFTPNGTLPTSRNGCGSGAGPSPTR